MKLYIKRETNGHRELKKHFVFLAKFPESVSNITDQLKFTESSLENSKEF
jgi:hypothetical protein